MKNLYEPRLLTATKTRFEPGVADPAVCTTEDVMVRLFLVQLIVPYNEHVTY